MNHENSRMKAWHPTTISWVFIKIQACLGSEPSKRQSNIYLVQITCSILNTLQIRNFFNIIHKLLKWLAHIKHLVLIMINAFYNIKIANHDKRYATKDCVTLSCKLVHYFLNNHEYKLLLKGNAHKWLKPCSSSNYCLWTRLCILY